MVMRKKMVAMLLSLVFLLACLPAMAAGAESDPPESPPGEVAGGEPAQPEDPPP